MRQFVSQKASIVLNYCYLYRYAFKESVGNDKIVDYSSVSDEVPSIAQQICEGIIYRSESILFLGLTREFRGDELLQPYSLSPREVLPVSDQVRIEPHFHSGAD